MRPERFLSIVPPYRHRHCPPSGAAALLGHLIANGHEEIGFLDLRLSTPDAYMPTYDAVGLFGDSFVVDVPDLPLVLSVLAAFDDGASSFAVPRSPVFDRYCYERGLEPDALVAYLAGMDRYLADAVAAMGAPKFVGFSTWSSNYTTTLIAAAHLKRLPSPPAVIAGGPQVTESRAAARLALDAGLFDAVVLGEGEGPLLEVYRAAIDGRSFDGLPAVLTRDTTEPASRKLLGLTNLVDPDFTRMDLAAYRADDGSIRLPYQLSRGCTDKCTFCSEWVFWERFRPDKPDHALDQLERLHRRYDVNRFHFTDSLINGHMGRLREFAEGIIARDLAVDWGGFMRADMDDETAAVLRRAGCSYAYIGVESLDDVTLALMNKRRTKADNIRAIESFLNAGIQVSVGVIPGFPGDTRDRFVKTAQLLSDMAGEHGGRFGFNVEPFIVSPGQPLYKDLASVGLESFGWDDDVLDIAPRFRSITEKIPCRVEGANQGSERLGQLRLLHMLTGGTTEAGVFDHREDLAADRVRIHHVDGPFVLAQAKHRGRLTGLLLTHEERAWILELVRTGRPGRSLFERPEFAGVWRTITERHVHVGDAIPFCVRTGVETKNRALSPFAIARRDGDDLVAVHLISQAVRVVPYTDDLTTVDALQEAGLVVSEVIDDQPQCRWSDSQALRVL